MIQKTDFEAFAQSEGFKVLGWCPIINDTQLIVRVEGRGNRNKCKDWFDAQPEATFVDAYELTQPEVDNQVMIEVFL